MKTRKYIYKILNMWDKVLSNQNTCFILCYHAIDEEVRFSTKLVDFEKQMKFILKTHTPISLSELISQIKSGEVNGKRSFVVSFDDGYKSILKVKDICKRYKIKPIVNLIRDESNAKNVMGHKFLSPDDISKLEKNGWEIGTHTLTHRVLTNLSNVELQKEIGASFKIKVISFPLGRYNKKIIKECQRQGYTIGLTMDDGFITGKSILMKLPRIGVDATHSFEEFKTLMSPTVVRFRSFLKNSFIKNYFLNI